MIQLTKELVDMHEEEVVLMIQDTLLNNIYKISSFEYQNPDPDRGKYYFGTNSCFIILIFIIFNSIVINSYRIITNW